MRGVKPLKKVIQIVNLENDEVVKMTDGKKLTKYEEAEKDYMRGMSYKQIAEKYDVAIGTVKTWKVRHGWSRQNRPQKVIKVSCSQDVGNNLPDHIKEKGKKIKENLLARLKEHGNTDEMYLEMVDSYIEFYYIKKYLKLDVEIRGVSVEWHNGKQVGIKKNECTSEATKVSAEMRAILKDLGLEAKAKVDDDDDI